LFGTANLDRRSSHGNAAGHARPRPPLVIVFGTIRVVADRSVKQQFFEALMEKYGTPDRDRPKGFFPRIDQVTVYVMTIGRMTGKELALPEVSRQWPAVDRTASPHAQPSDAA
jgi:hypothetical protein